MTHGGRTPLAATKAIMSTKIESWMLLE